MNTYLSYVEMERFRLLEC